MWVMASYAVLWSAWLGTWLGAWTSRMIAQGQLSVMLSSNHRDSTYPGQLHEWDGLEPFAVT